MDLQAALLFPGFYGSITESTNNSIIKLDSDSFSNQSVSYCDLKKGMSHFLNVDKSSTLTLEKEVKSRLVVLYVCLNTEHKPY